MDDGNHDGLGTYWDPLPTARRLLTDQPHLDRFSGHWDERNWRNVPGPFYGADTDSLQLGRRDAPFHLAHDDDHGPFSGREFVYRQPVGAAQTRDLLDGCTLGHGGFAMDGDDHWTVPAVREWWQERGRVREWAVEAADRWSRARGEHREHYRDAAGGLRDYIAHLDHGLEEYLRGYLLWLAERRPRRPGESLPLLERPRPGATLPPTVGTAPTPAPAPGAGATAGEPVLASYFVAVPEPVTGSGLPRTKLLTTASDCLIDRLPQDGCWFPTAQDALAACAPLDVPAAARLLALLVPAGHAAALATDIRAADGHEPVLLARLDGRADDPDDPATPERGHQLGWEVLGYDHGLLHSWLCNDLYREAVHALGVDTDDRGLLSGREAAERVATWANGLGDTKPVTWFPAALVEWNAPIETHFEPITTEAPRPPRPWWQRFTAG
ncbi:hypothetical protein ACFWA9_20875 [Kitasatospora sp. NPDC059973]|uniref:hypothetical protein n=1 Tax=Kitasatospora sp. NPDC059973 TaxID=3347020 RepID=UPI0036D1EC96